MSYLGKVNSKNAAKMRAPLMRLDGIVQRSIVVDRHQEQSFLILLEPHKVVDTGFNNQWIWSIKVVPSKTVPQVYLARNKRGYVCPKNVPKARSTFME